MRASVKTLLVLGIALSAQAQEFGRPPVLRTVGIDQNLNAQIPLETIFKDEAGQTVRLGQYFGEKPVILALVYYQCPMLCNQVLNALVHGMRAISLTAGTDYDVITLSFDPRETPALAAAKKETYLRKYARPAAAGGWHFLTGSDENIHKVTDAAGFHYKLDPATNQYAHASGIMLLTPEGKFSRYFYGINYQSKDLRLGLVEASNNKIGSAVDQILLFCYHYDPSTGRYGLVIMNIIRVSAIATLAALLTMLFILIRRERRNVWRTV